MVLGVLVTASAALGETRVGGKLRGEHEWTKEGNPYIVTRDIIVAKGSTLRLGPGVTVRFKPNIVSSEGTNHFDLEILVKGTLIVEGAAEDDSESPMWADWQGIVVQGKEARAELKAVVITNCLEGVKCFQGTVVADGVNIKRNMMYGMRFIQGRGELNDVFITQVGNSGGTGVGVNCSRGSEVTIRNSFIIGSQNGVTYIQKSTGSIVNTMVTLCIARGVIIRNSSIDVTRCTISNNDYGMIVSAGSMPLVRENNIFQNATVDLSLSEYSGDPVRIDFSSNWWGETHLGLIEERILDATDEPGRNAFAMIEPVLTEAIVHEPEE
jgi:parallel beta-helix repeat protein